MNTVTIKSQDKAMSFETFLLKNGAVPSNLADATGVNFLMKRVESPGTAYSFSATLESASTGKVSVEIPTGFPTAPGTYKQEWEVIFPTAKPLTFPSEGYNTIIILADLN